MSLQPFALRLKIHVKTVANVTKRKTYISASVQSVLWEKFARTVGSNIPNIHVTKTLRLPVVYFIATRGEKASAHHSVYQERTSEGQGP